MVNPDEIQLLMINSQNDKDQALLTSNAHVIKSTEDFSLLGVNIEEHLVFSKRICELCKKKKKSGPYKSLILPEFTLYGTYVKPPAPEKLKEYRNGLLRLSITHIQWSTSISFIVPIYLAYKVGVYKILLP